MMFLFVIFFIFIYLWIFLSWTGIFPVYRVVHWSLSDSFVTFCTVLVNCIVFVFNQCIG